MGQNVLSVAVRAVGKTATLFGRKFAGKRGNVETGLTLLEECTEKVSTLRPAGFLLTGYILILVDRIEGTSHRCL